MKPGDYVKTPRFLTVKIETVFNSYKEAEAAGYKETTHYTLKHDDGYDVVGKQLDMYHMEFAGVKL